MRRTGIRATIEHCTCDAGRLKLDGAPPDHYHWRLVEYRQGQRVEIATGSAFHIDSATAEMDRFLEEGELVITHARFVVAREDEP